MKKSLIAASIMASLALTSLTAQAETSYLWQDTLDQAKGQTVYFNAWGGADNINDYIQWAADRIKEEYDVTLKQVKIDRHFRRRKPSIGRKKPQARTAMVQSI